MPDFYTHPIVVPGDTWTASNQMTYVKGNLDALFVGLAAGDIDFYSSAASKARLAKPASRGLLTNGSDAVLAWLTVSGNANKFLRVNSAGNNFEFAGGGAKADYHSNTTPYSYSTSSWRDVPNSSKSITVDVTSTVVCIGMVEHHSTDSPNFYGFSEFKFNIDGTDIDWAVTAKNYGTTLLPIPIIGLKTGVGAGSKTVKIRERCGAGSYESNYKHYAILVFPE